MLLLAYLLVWGFAIFVTAAWSTSAWQRKRQRIISIACLTLTELGGAWLALVLRSTILP